MEDGLFQCVAGKAAIAGGAGIGFLPAGIIAQQGFGAAFGQGVALVFGKDLTPSNAIKSSSISKFSSKVFPFLKVTFRLTVL